jgi:hypothetical protein
MPCELSRSFCADLALTFRLVDFFDLIVRREVVGSDPDDVASMMGAALQAARNRVVLKRPQHAASELMVNLTASELVSERLIKPSHSYEGTRHRFDVFSGFQA